MKREPLREDHFEVLVAAAEKARTRAEIKERVRERAPHLRPLSRPEPINTLVGKKFLEKVERSSTSSDGWDRFRTTDQGRAACQVEISRRRALLDEVEKVIGAR